MATQTHETTSGLKWEVDNEAGLVAVTVHQTEVGRLAYNRDTGTYFRATTAGSGATIWEPLSTGGHSASGVNYIKRPDATTGNHPVISAEGEVNTGLSIANSEGELIVDFDAVATGITWLKFINAASGGVPTIQTQDVADTGLDIETSEGEEMFQVAAAAGAVNNVRVVNAVADANPIIMSYGDTADTGLAFHNEQGEEMLVLECSAGGVNHVQITNAVADANPVIASAGDTADTGLEFENEQGETMLILECVASGDNYVTITNGTDHPEIAALGAGTNVNLELIPKALGYVDFQGGQQWETQTVTADDSSSSLNQIEVGARQVEVDGVTNGVNDYVELPAIADCPVGHKITIVCNGSSAFELRTPAASNTKINGVDADGDQEYPCTDTNVVYVTKLTDNTGWMVHEFDAVGAIVAADLPD